MQIPLIEAETILAHVQEWNAAIETNADLALLAIMARIDSAEKTNPYLMRTIRMNACLQGKESQKAYASFLSSFMITWDCIQRQLEKIPARTYPCVHCGALIDLIHSEDDCPYCGKQV